MHATGRRRRLAALGEGEPPSDQKEEGDDAEGDGDDRARADVRALSLRAQRGGALTRGLALLGLAKGLRRVRAWLGLGLGLG